MPQATDKTEKLWLPTLQLRDNAFWICCDINSNPSKPQTRLRGCTDFSQQQGQDAGKLGVHRKSAAIPQATKVIMELDSSCAQTCDYVVCAACQTQ